MKDNKIQFSVLMSVYKNDNSENFRSAVNSVIHQTVKPNEIVIMVDGPVDLELRKSLDEFATLAFVKIIKLKENGGLGHALKVGVMHCNYPYIARMDSDDISLPNRFELQLKEAKAHPELSIIGGQVDEFSGTIDQLVGKREVPLTERKIRNFIKWRNPFNHPTVLIKKHDLEQVGGYRSYGNLEDYYLWVRMISMKYMVKNLPQVLVHMRVDAGLYSRRGKINNMRYFIRLRRYMKKTNLINVCEEVIGNIIIFLNIVIPGNIRKYVYQHILHQKI